MTKQNKPEAKLFPTNDTVGYAYDTTAEILMVATHAIYRNAPDTRTLKNALVVLGRCVSAYIEPVTTLWYLSEAFEELRDKAEHKEFTPTAKNRARSEFYEGMHRWAAESFDLMDQAEPDEPVKDAEDDSDPYVKRANKPSTVTVPDTFECCVERIFDELRTADFPQRRLDSAASLFHSIVLERSEKATLLDVLEQFGDEASELSWNNYEDTEANETFWNACVMLSDDLRAEIAAAQIKKTVAPVVHSSEPKNAGEMWEVIGDPHRALFHVKDEAEKWAREVFPTETSMRRYARVQYRTILKF